jgi:adenosine deaminase
LEDFQNDGVVYLELRTTPRAMPAAHITKDDYVQTVLDVISQHNDDASNRMRTFLILSIDRRNTPAEAEEVVDLAIKYQSSGVVGVDLCGDPVKGDVRIFADAFARAKAAGLKMTLHFAETETSGSDVELSTLLSWKPDRLGHVIHVKEEYRMIIEEQNIGVELCLSCNVHAKMITGTYADHHFGMWRHTTVPLALSVHTIAHAMLSAVLTYSRLMTWGFSAILCRRSTTWLQSTLILIVAKSKHCVSAWLNPFLLVLMRSHVSEHYTLIGTDEPREWHTLC